MGPALVSAAGLSQPAVQAFDRYITNVETRLAGQHADRDTYLVMRDPGASVPDAERDRRPSAVRVEAVNGGSWGVNGGLLHHWRAGAFVPKASSRDLLALLRDYNNLSRYYAPEVVSSRLLADDRDGDMVSLAMRFKKRRVITIVLDTEFATRSGLADDSRGYSFARSTHIWQIDQPETANERRRAEGADDGFLWRLNSYWSFEEKHGGLLMECEAVSLTRDIPVGLGWLIKPIIDTLPRASLEFTLTATRNALAARTAGRNLDDHAN
jgi:hypothetical protein